LPGGNSLFFCFAKSKVSKRKGDPQSESLRFDSGNLRCSIPAAVQTTRFAQTSLARRSASICAARLSQNGLGKLMRVRGACKREALACDFAFVFLPQIPSWLGLKKLKETD
jgi:hypothetical protein